jgi:hypothetical protein
MSDRSEDGLSKVELNKADLRLLHNALNEILHGIVVSEFETRIGTSRDEATSLLRRLQAQLDRM